MKPLSAHIMEHPDGHYQFDHAASFTFKRGGIIDSLTLVYETYGKLNASADNTILVHHALSADSHLASTEKNSRPGWWESMVGPGKVIDTENFYVICINNLGSCFGSSGPASVCKKTGKPYRTDFPAVTIDDMVFSQHLLLQSLGIKKIYAVIGNSMGAMLSLAWSIYFPHQVQRLISISSAYRAYPVNIAKHRVAREIVRLDPDWCGGHYIKNPIKGLKTARTFDHLSYRSPDELNTRFVTGEELQSYLDYNAQKFTNIFDANAYLYLTQAMDWFNAMHIQVPPKAQAFENIEANVLVISVSSDVLFQPYQQSELVQCLREAGVTVTFVQHDSDRGHDAFYNDATMGDYIQCFLNDA